MKMASATVLDVQESWPQRLLRGWNQFWFTPGDPTTLGFVRICCGLIVLYVHLAYTFDLQEFMGNPACLDVGVPNASRHEAPGGKMPDTWDESPPYLPPLADDDPQKPYVEEYIAKWGRDP